MCFGSPAARAHLEKQIDDLFDEFHGVVSRETISRVVDESIKSLGEVHFDNSCRSSPTAFSRERLVALVETEGSIVKEACQRFLSSRVHNVGRSQMTAALLNARGEGRVQVR